MIMSEKKAEEGMSIWKTGTESTFLLFCYLFKFNIYDHLEKNVNPNRYEQFSEA